MGKKIQILLFFCFPLALRANLPGDPIEYAAWGQKMLSAIDQRKQSPPEIAIPKLGALVSQLSQGANVEFGERPVFHAAQSALLAIPGHAKYYQEQIEQTREFVKYYHALPKEEQIKLQNQSREEEAQRHTPVGGLTDRLSYGQVCYNTKAL